jgi:hypothetical protein
MALHLVGGNLAKARKLNPYKRIQKGVEKDIKVNGEDVKAITDTAGKYSYLTIGGVDYYISDNIEAGAEFTTEDIVAKPKAEPKAKKEQAEGGEEGEAAVESEPKRRKAAEQSEAAAA